MQFDMDKLNDHHVATWGELVSKWHREGLSVKRIAKKTGLQVETIRSMLGAKWQGEQKQPNAPCNVWRKTND